LYTAEYDDSSLIESGVSPLWVNAKIYVAAEFCVIPSLKIMAQAKFEQIATNLFRQPKTLEEQKELPAVVEFIYENTVDKAGPGLREAVVKIILLHANDVFGQHDLREGLRSTMEKSGEFGRDFSFGVFKKWEGFRKVQCQGCLHIWADPRPRIPDTHCPDCQDFRHNWNDYEVE
jgi:hypothetical protein